MSPAPAEASPAAPATRHHCSGRVRRIAGLLAGSGLLALLLRQFGVGDTWTALRHVDVGHLAVYFLLAAGIVAACSVRSYLVARTSGVTPRFRRFVVARLAGDAAGALLPGGRVSGDPLRVALLYSHGAQGVQASSWIVVDRLLEVLGNTVAALLYLVAIAMRHSLGFLVPLASALGAGLVGLAAVTLVLRSGRRPLSPFLAPLENRLPRLRVPLASLRAIEEQLGALVQQHAPVLLIGLLLSLAIEVGILVEYSFLFRSFGLELDLATLVLALLATGLARGLPMPGGIGALEAGQVAALSVGLGRPDLGFIAGIVVRLHETVWFGIGALALVLEPRSRELWRWCRLGVLRGAPATATGSALPPEVQR